MRAGNQGERALFEVTAWCLADDGAASREDEAIQRK